MTSVPSNAGRPREYDRLKIGDDLIEWAKNNPDCLTIPHFATSIGLHSRILINWCEQDSEFRDKYMLAKEIIGLNRLKATRIEDESVQKRLDKSIYMQTLHHFDYDTKHDVREDKKYENDLKIASNAPANQNIYVNTKDFSEKSDDSK